MLFMHDADHLFAADLERGAGGYGGGRCQAQSRHRGERLFSYKISRRQQRDRGFFADLRNDSDFRTASLKIKDGVRGISLGKERLFGFTSTILRPRPALARKAAGSNKAEAARFILRPPFQPRHRNTKRREQRLRESTTPPATLFFHGLGKQSVPFYTSFVAYRTNPRELTTRYPQMARKSLSSAANTDSSQ